MYCTFKLDVRSEKLDKHICSNLNVFFLGSQNNQLVQLQQNMKSKGGYEEQRGNTERSSTLATSIPVRTDQCAVAS